MITKRTPIFRYVAWVGFAAALLLNAPATRAEEEKQSFQLSEKVSEALQTKMKGLQDAKNFNGMLELVDGQLKTVPPTSYDACYLLDLKARIYCQLEQYTKAIEPWEETLKLADQYGYKDEKDRLDITKYLAQFIFIQAQDTKDKAKQATEIAKSATYLKRYLDRTPRQEPETQMMYAQILYYQATGSGSNQVDMKLLNEARQVVEKGMLGSIRPKEGFYLLKLAILQALNDHMQSAETMELLLQQYPNKKDVWPMLFGTYVNLAGASKPESKTQKEYYVRAINTLERAQKLGFMNTQRDNYNLFTLYLNAGEINLATDLLYNGMKSGSIEPSVANWRILGAYYQQANKELQAISALEEATKLYPKDGSIEFMIGQIYGQLERTKDAHDHYAKAVAKGNLGEKPHQAWLFLAYTALELQDYDGALKAINEALKMPDGAKDPQVKSVKDGIDATIAEREAQKQARESATKKL